LQNPNIPVWSNVTAERHDERNLELLRDRLVRQIVSPVRWSQSCAAMIAAGHASYDELAPGSVLRGLMRRIDRNAKVESHDEP
jgi:[acyl-carrier-protein] S-malonyltransferase